MPTENFALIEFFLEFHANYRERFCLYIFRGGYFYPRQAHTRVNKAQSASTAVTVGSLRTIKGHARLALSVRVH